MRARVRRPTGRETKKPEGDSRVVDDSTAKRSEVKGIEAVVIDDR